MGERIYTRDEHGRLEPLEEQPFSTEDDLQALIAEHPELLDGEQIRPGDPRRWLLITREQGIPEVPGSGDRWSLDHLIVDQDAVPTLAEVKRGSNSEIRRTIVGQVLEYAAHASLTWSAEELRRTFEESATHRGFDPQELLAELLQTGGDPDADGFWNMVATNMAARRMRLLFVADEIPDPLERVVEFLNEQMPNIEVLAVEIKQFLGGQSQTLVPRVIGRTANAASSGSVGRRRGLNREAFLDACGGEEERRVAVQLLDAAESAGGRLEWGSRGVSIRGSCSLWEQPITVAWIYPPDNTGGGWMRTRDLTFGVAILDDDPSDELRLVLQRWVDVFRDDDFTSDVSSRGVVAWSVDYGAAIGHIDLLSRRLEGVLNELGAMGS